MTTLLHVLKIFTLLLLPVTAIAASPLHVQTDIHEYPLGLHMDILEDENDDYTIQQVSSASLENQWRPNNQSVPNFSFSKSAYWLRIPIQSQLPETTVWWLELAFPLHDYVDFYVADNTGKFQTVKTGDRRHFNTRQHNFRNFIFNVPLHPQKITMIYMHIQSEDGLHEALPLTLWNPTTFAMKNSSESIFIGIYFGLMAAMALYNLFLFFSIKSPTYFYYVLYISFCLFWFIIFYGFAFQFLWPNSPEFSNRILIITANLLTIPLVLFIRGFLDTKNFAPFFNKILYACCIFSGSTLIYACIGSYSLGILLYLLLAVPFCFLVIILGIICLKRGNSIARYFLIAWSLLLIGFLAFALKVFGIIESNVFVDNSVQLGSALEVILLSLGLASRINRLKLEKKNAELQFAQSQERAMLLTRHETQLKQNNAKLILLNEQLDEAKQQAEKANEAKTTLLGRMSHELRTPLNAILGFAQLQEHYIEINDVADLKLSQHHILEAGKHLLVLVDEVLDLVKAEQHDLTITFETVELHTVIEESLLLIQGQAKQRHISIQYQPSTLSIKANTLRIKQILLNLLSNAIKYNIDGGSIIITTQRLQENIVEIAVKDSGVGISPEDQENIFMPFIRLAYAEKNIKEGTGIGLTLTKFLVEQMQGTIGISSTGNDGTLFWIRFPLANTKT